MPTGYTIDEVIGVLPDLKQAGGEWKGPCPLCGGDDRFRVTNQNGTAGFGCRGCLDPPNDPDKAHFRDLMAMLKERLGRDRRPETYDTPFVAHICTRLCVAYSLVETSQRLTSHRKNEGESGGSKNWTYPKMRPRPRTYALLHAPLGDYDAAYVVLAEGTKSAFAIVDAGYQAATWNGGSGSNAVQMANFAPLTGKHVLIWPDGDVPGLTAARAIQQKLGKVAASVRVVDVTLMGVDPSNPPARRGKDAADVAAEVRQSIITATMTAPENAIDLPAPTADLTGTATEYSDQWELTPTADTQRLLRGYAADLLVVFDSEGTADLMMAAKSIWRLDRGRLEAAQIATAKEWEGAAFTLADYNDAVEVRKHAVTLASPQGQEKAFKMTAAAYNRLRDQGELPSALSSCDQPRLDADRLCLGAPNGVLDVTTGRMLSPREARDRYITRMLPDPYDEDARHPLVDKLFERMDDAEREWLFQAMGYSLRGYCEERIYVVKGDTKAGKTSVGDALRYSLGDEYASKLPSNTFTASGWESRDKAEPGKFFVANGFRVAVLDEPIFGRRGQLEWSVVKDVSGSMSGTARQLNKNPVPLNYTATMFWLMNDWPTLPTEGDGGAVQERLRAIEWQTIPEGERDPNLKKLFLMDAKARQTLVALMVRYCIETKTPPDDVRTVTAARSEMLNSSKGEVVLWLEKNLIRDSHGTLATTELWEALTKDLGDDDGNLDNWTKARVTRRARGIFDLPLAAHISGTTNRGWEGIRFKRADDQTIDDEQADLVCFAPLPGGGECGQPLNDAGECDVGDTHEDGAPPAAGGHGAVAGGDSGSAPTSTAPPQQGSLLEHVEARLDAMTVPAPNAHINPQYQPMGELWPWAMAGALRGMRAAMLDNPALIPPAWVDAAWILNDLEEQAKAVGSRGGGPAGKVEQRIEQQDWKTNLADLRREVARLDAERGRGLAGALAQFVGEMAQPQGS